MLHSAILALAAAAPQSSPPQSTPPPIVVIPAPPAAPAVKPDPAAVAEAVRLLDAEGFEQQAISSSELAVDTMLVGMVEQMQKAARQQVPADFIAQLKQTMRDHSMGVLRANMASIKRQAAEIYAQEFTAAELAHLRKLAADPVVTKARERRQVIEPKLMMIGIRTMRAAQPELEAKLKRLISDYTAAHGKLGAKTTS